MLQETNEVRSDMVYWRDQITIHLLQLGLDARLREIILGQIACITDLEVLKALDMRLTCGGTRVK